jgi:enoyl reductase-like protein
MRTLSTLYFDACRGELQKTMAEGQKQIAATMADGQDQTAKSNEILASTIGTALNQIDQLTAGQQGIASTQDAMHATVHDIDQKTNLVIEDVEKLNASHGKFV